MGLFSSLFGKKEDTTDNSKNAVSSKTSNSSANNPSLHLRGKADSNGLYPSELVMLAVAEKYKTTETKFPGYLTHTYEVTNPQKMLKDLQSRGFIDIGNAKDILPNYKVSELKEFASSLGVEVKGKKYTGVVFRRVCGDLHFCTLVGCVVEGLMLDERIVVSEN